MNESCPSLLLAQTPLLQFVVGVVQQLVNCDQHNKRGETDASCVDHKSDDMSRCYGFVVQQIHNTSKYWSLRFRLCTAPVIIAPPHHLMYMYVIIDRLGHTRWPCYIASVCQWLNQERETIITLAVDMNIHHRLHSTVVRVTSHFNGRCQNSTPRISITP